MSIHKLVTPYMNYLSNRVRGSINQAVYLLRILYNHVPYQHETLFLHGKGPLNQIILCLHSQNRSQAWLLLCHNWFILPTLYFQGLARNSVLANRFRLWYLSCFNLHDGFVNVTERVIIPLLFCGRRQNIGKWLVTWHMHHGS